MNILIIDNGTIHLNNFKEILADHQCTIFPNRDILTINYSQYDAAILSGSSESSAVKHRDLFFHQRELIQSCPIPILGVCFGFELMILTFGGRMIRLADKIQGIKTLTYSLDPLFDGVSELRVYEGHRWITPQAPDIFIPLAYSDTGIEVIKHKNSPMYGVQFHPEVSKENTNGSIILKNFIEIVANKQH